MSANIDLYIAFDFLMLSYFENRNDIHWAIN